MINQLQNNFLINTLKAFLEKSGKHAFVVGGFIRDCLLGQDSCDVDIVVPKGSAFAFSKDFAESIEGYWVELDNDNNIYRVVFPDKVNYIDIADCVGESIEEDLKRRDFTINALAYDISNGKVLDVVGGLDDLNNGIIREISVVNIADDAIRILRAFRFKSQFGFVFSKTLEDFLSDHAYLLNNIAKERINVELVKLFGGEHAVLSIVAMDNIGILEFLIPEVKDIKKIPPNSHHHLNLFEHSLETVKQVHLFYQNCNDDVKAHFNKKDFGVCERLAYLKLAAFLHDVGKPSTWLIEPETGRHRFIMHDSEGAKVIVPTLKDLKFSKKQIAYIQKLIKNHIYPAGVVTSEDASEKARLRFYRKMEDETIDVIAIAYADRLSALGEDVTQEMVAKNIDGLNELLLGYVKQKNNIAPLPKLLDGQEIMELLDIPASPLLGQIIRQLKEAQISSDVNTKEEAVEFIKRFLK